MPHTLTVTAYDANNNVATGYTGTIAVTSTDLNAAVPSNTTFNGVSGIATPSDTLKSTGTWAISASDTVNPR